MVTNYFRQLESILPTGLVGRVQRMEGVVTAVAGLPAPLGALVEIHRQTGTHVLGEVIGFRDDSTLIYPLGDITGVCRGNSVRLARTCRSVGVGEGLLGRVINAHGTPIDGGPGVEIAERRPLHAPPPPAMSRPRIREPLSTGIRSIDALLTCGRGQRLGIFAGAGVGKSILLGMMSRFTSADVNVIALIGERGREVNDFLQRDLTAEGRQNSVVIVATSDEPALLRVQAAMTATVIAEFFRDLGNDVLLMMDSISRFATAQREIGLAAGEPPTTRGYPPSVHALLPKLVERAGRSERGSITAFYSVLVEGDDPHEPISDAVRSLLDGHIVLSRKLASSGHYPAIDPLESISRLNTEVCSERHQRDATTIRRLLAAYRDHEDLITIGAYRPGTQPFVDLAIRMREPIREFLEQPLHESSDLPTTLTQLEQLAAACQKRDLA
jgi:flagellum-specific ATP synthase